MWDEIIAFFKVSKASHIPEWNGMSYHVATIDIDVGLKTLHTKGGELCGLKKLGFEKFWEKKIRV